jgi:hypothetical protein
MQLELNKIYLWEILVPTIHGDTGKPIHLRYHKVWDKKVQQLSGGLTILTPVKGSWVSETGKCVSERSIPVRIACELYVIHQIANFTADYYKQKAILFYMVSEHCYIKSINDHI